MSRSEIQKLIDDDINPALAEHGGYLSIDKYEDKINIYV